MIQNINDLLNNITEDIYQNLKRAVELGKWPNGEVVPKEQHLLCMQAVIAYEEKNLPAEQRSGYIPYQEHTHCGSTEVDITCDKEQPLVFK